MAKRSRRRLPSHRALPTGRTPARGAACLGPIALSLALFGGFQDGESTHVPEAPTILERFHAWELEVRALAEDGSEPTTALLTRAEDLGLGLSTAPSRDLVEEEFLQVLLLLLERTPEPSPKAAYDSFYLALARARCLDLLRRLEPLRLACGLAPQLERSLEGLVLYVEGLEGDTLSGWEEPCHQLVGEAVPKLIQLELDLGRLDRARVWLTRGKDWLRRLEASGAQAGLPVPMLFAGNQLAVLQGAYGRIRSAAQVQLKGALRPQDVRHLERVALLSKGYALLEELPPGEVARSASDSYRAESQAFFEGLDPQASQGDAVSMLRVLDRRVRLAALAEDHASEQADRELLGALIRRLPDDEVAQLLAIGLRARAPQTDQQAARSAALERARNSWLSAIARFSTPIEGGQGTLGDPLRRDVLCELLLAILQTDPRGALELLVETQAQGTYERVLTQPNPSVETVQEALGRLEAGLLIYVPGEASTLLCALDARGPRWFPLAGSSAYRQDVEALEGPYGEPAEGSRRAAARRLHDWLLPAELEEWTRAWELALVLGRDLLWDLDFEVLIDKRGELLGMQRALSYVPSVPLIVEWEQRARAREDRGGSRVVAAVGIEPPASFAGRFRSLPPPGKWLDPLGFEETERFTGPAAQLAACNATEVRLLTLFAHGVLDYSKLRPAGVVLADGIGSQGRVFGWEELRQTTPPPVVSLLVCNASVGHLRPGNGGLDQSAGALLLAGADTVISAGSELNAQLALDLQAAWIQGLRAGNSPARSLVYARRRVADRLREGERPALAHLQDADVAVALQAFGLGARISNPLKNR